MDPGFSVHIVDTRTGTVVLNDLPVLGTPDFDRSINDDGSVQIDIPFGDGGVPNGHELRELTAEWRFSLAVSYGPAKPGSPILAYGPIMTSAFDHRSQNLKVGAGSMWALLARRLLLDPLGVVSSPLSMDEAMDANYAALTLWAIASKLVEDTISRGTGYELPIDLPDLTGTTVGDNERNFPVYDLASVGQRLKDLTQVEQGPDIDWDARFTSANQVRVAMRVGTPTLQQVGQDLIWDGGSAVTVMDVDRNGGTMTTDVFTRGNQTERAMQTAWAADRGLVGNGWPILESVDGSHQSVELFDTLQAHANEYIRFHRRPVELWYPEVATDETPLCGTYKPGDYGQFNLQSHPYIPPGLYRQRLLGWSPSGPGRLKLKLEATEGSL